MRKVNDMFYIINDRLVKTSNDQPIPDDEPVFILRARDANALPLLVRYREYCRESGSPQQRVDDLANVINQFEKFKNRNAHKMKIPGITLGK